MKTKERYIQWIMIGIMTILLTLVSKSAFQTYQTSQSIHTSIPGGSSLAERYLILGDWPSSNQHPDPTIQHLRYEIINQTSD